MAIAIQFFVACLLVSSIYGFPVVAKDAVDYIAALLTTNFRNDAIVRLRPSQLIGGPKWLPLHLQLVIGDQYIWDFVPQNATSPTTLRNLLLLQSVPGEIRCRQKPQPETSTIVVDDAFVDRKSLQRCAINYVDSVARDTNLNLLTNNCWTFGFGMFIHLQNRLWRLRNTRGSVGSMDDGDDG